MIRKKDEQAAMAFAAKLKTLREASGLSIYALAKKAGISTESASKLEQGAHVPSWSTVMALADALGVSVADFR